ncbi:cation efflux protein [Dendrothele bispora CBS 962.96]|uniref:Cation efflux protein n=1 Tax=Dendrothele bispora (strain CBS 962.96) TaxID=1314807 RepID=A0A4S8KTW4_DENBC|nr:cation efflux protein [Dendrothele bispora CBS 962.96]
MQVTTRLGIVLGISLVFFGAEIAVGFKTKSLALIADAFHYLNDVVAYAIAYAAAYLQQHGKHTSQFTYAFNRAELVGAFFNGVFLLALGLSIALQSLERFVNLQEIDNPMLVMIIGCIGLILNATSALVVGHQHPGHSHGHGPDPDTNDHGIELQPIAGTGAIVTQSGASRPSTRAVHADHYHTLEPAAILPPAGTNLGLMGVLIHVLGDAVNNIAVIVAAVLIWKLHSHARFYADPAVSLGISLIIFWERCSVENAVVFFLKLLLYIWIWRKLGMTLFRFPDVLSVHDLHVWHLSQSDILASLHVCVPTETSMSEWSRIESEIQHCFAAYGVRHVTISPELPHPPAYMSFSNSTSGQGKMPSGSWGRDMKTDMGKEEEETAATDTEGATPSHGTCGIPIPEKEGFGCSMGRVKKRTRVSDQGQEGV